MDKKDTKERILDAAEELFAAEGFHATSLRAITKKADVNLSAVNYHFGSKEEMIAEVIKRRLVPLNELRLQRLQAVLESPSANPPPARVEAILRAFIEPTISYRAAGHNSFITIIGRSFAEPDDTVRNIFIGLMEPIFTLMLSGLARVLPEHPREVLFWRLHFMVGATCHSLRCLTKCPMTGALGEQQLKSNPDALIALLVPFVTAGMEAPL